MTLFVPVRPLVQDIGPHADGLHGSVAFSVLFHSQKDAKALQVILLIGLFWTDEIV